MKSTPILVFEPLSDERRSIPSIRYRTVDIVLAFIFSAITLGIAIWAMYAPDSPLKRPSFEPLDWIVESWEDMQARAYKEWVAKQKRLRNEDYSKHTWRRKDGITV